MRAAIQQRGGVACCSTSLPASPRQSLRHAAPQLWRQCNLRSAVGGKRGRKGSGSPPRLQVLALDAAMPFDFESRAKDAITRASRLKVGIVGFGTFGQFLAKRIRSHGHDVIATSRTPYHAEADALGVRFLLSPDDFCEEHPDVVVLASSILSSEAVLRSLPVQRLRRNTLFVDVLSVKVFPKQLMLASLPAEVDVLCTHPMFGPDSGKGSWDGLNLMYERVRVGPEKRRQQRCDTFLQIFRDEGCRMVEMTCEEHDVKAASSQFITHTVGRMLGAMQLERTDIDTKGFQSLLNLVENTTNDSFDLYYGLFLYNQNATEELTRLEMAFDDVRRQLFGRLHGKLREQLFHQQQAQGPGQQQQLALPESSSSTSAYSSSTASSSAGLGSAAGPGAAAGSRERQQQQGGYAAERLGGGRAQADSGRQVASSKQANGSSSNGAAAADERQNT